MHFARPVPPRTTKATVRFGSSLSPPVTSLAAALTAALVAEPAFRSAGRLDPPACAEPPACARGLFFYFVPQSAKSGARIHFDAVAMSARRERAPAVRVCLRYAA